MRASGALLLACALGVAKSVHADDPTVVPLTPSEAGLVSPVVSFAGFDLNYVPVTVRLRIANPTGQALRVGLPLMGSEAPSSDALEGSTVRTLVIEEDPILVEVHRDGSWKPRPYDIVKRRWEGADISIPPDSACLLEISFPPIGERIRYGILLSGQGEANRIWTDPIDPPASFEACRDLPEAPPFVEFVAFDQRVESTKALFRLVNPSSRFVSFSGYAIGHPYRLVEYLPEEGPVGQGGFPCGHGLDTIDLPPRSAMAFEEFLFDRRDPFRLELHAEGTVLLSPRVVPPPIHRALAADEHAGSEPFVALVKVADEFERMPEVWLEIVNPTTGVVRFPAERPTVPAYLVEVWDQGRFEARETVWTRKTGYSASDPPARKIEIELPPRTRQYFSVGACFTREPMRVGVPLSVGESPEHMAWSDRVDVPPFRNGERR